MKADEHTKLITGYKVTPANVHDSEMLGALIVKEIADKKYMPIVRTGVRKLKKS